MRCYIHLIGVALSLGLGIQASAQGLLAVQNYSSDFKNDQPLTWSITGRSGFDSLRYKIPSGDDFESYFLQGGVGASFTDADPTTPWSIDVDLGAIHYLDGMDRYDDTFYNARIAFNIAHQISERLKVSNNFYLSYEAEPNLATGASTTLYNGQYLYGFNNFNVSYAWSQRFSTTTSYTIDGISYDDDVISSLEDRLSHLIAQQFSYAVTKQTNVVAEYRFGLTKYREQSDADFRSHFALAGVDHAWSERFSGSFRAGAQFYKSDRSKNVAPYAETALSYAVARETMVRWFASLGYDAAELGGFDNRYSVRTGLNASHQITKKLATTGGLSYSYSQFDGGALGGDVAEHSVLLSAGLSYQILQNLAVDAQYSYSLLESDDAIREFDRHRVSLGLTASF